MNAYKANILNAASLVLLSIWAYFGSINPSITAFIPFTFGIILLSLNNGVQYKVDSQVRTAAIITLIVFISLIKPMSEFIFNENKFAIFRVGVMMCTSLLSLIYFIINHSNILLFKKKK